MIELKELTNKERVNITIQCEPIFLVAKKNRVFNKLHEELMTYFSKKYSNEVWLLITTITKAMRYDNNGARFSLNKAHFITANKIHKQKLSLCRTKHVIEVLDRESYFLYYKGFRFSKEDNMTTCLIFTEKLKTLIDYDMVKKCAAKRDPLSYIEVKDIDNNNILLSIKDFRGYSKHMKFMERYNNLLSSIVIKAMNEDTGELIKCSVVYKQIFSGDLHSAGRLYEMGTFQTKKSKYRKYITINGECTTEVDLSNLHPRLLYTAEGIQLPVDWDAYKIDSLLWVCGDAKLLRDFIKSAYLSVLFSESYEQAWKSVLSKANRVKYTNVKNKEHAKVIVDEVLSKNKSIAHYFFQSRLWARLQNMDSRITTYIIDYFTNIGVACLGWHDSYVVPLSYQETLLKVMKEAWVTLFDTDMNFKYDIEF